VAQPLFPLEGYANRAKNRAESRRACTADQYENITLSTSISTDFTMASLDTVLKDSWTGSISPPFTWTALNKTDGTLKTRVSLVVTSSRADVLDNGCDTSFLRSGVMSVEHWGVRSHDADNQDAILPNSTHRFDVNVSKLCLLTKGMRVSEPSETQVLGFDIRTTAGDRSPYVRDLQPITAMSIVTSNVARLSCVQTCTGTDSNPEWYETSARSCIAKCMSKDNADEFIFPPNRKINVDLNDGSGGRYIYATVSREPRSDGKVLTGLNTVRCIEPKGTSTKARYTNPANFSLATDGNPTGNYLFDRRRRTANRRRDSRRRAESIPSCDCAHLGSGWVKDPNDLNKGVNTIYAIFTCMKYENLGTGNVGTAITDIDVTAAETDDSSAPNVPGSWTKRGDDLNLGCGFTNQHFNMYSLTSKTMAWAMAAPGSTAAQPACVNPTLRHAQEFQAGPMTTTLRCCCAGLAASSARRRKSATTTLCLLA
jgi:hypothetical protein